MSLNGKMFNILYVGDKAFSQAYAQYHAMAVFK